MVHSVIITLIELGLVLMVLQDAINIQGFLHPEDVRNSSLVLLLLFTVKHSNIIFESSHITLKLLVKCAISAYTSVLLI